MNRGAAVAFVAAAVATTLGWWSNSPFAHAEPAPAAAEPECRLRFGEKLGIPYVWVCRPGEPGGFWITAIAHACSAGSHESIRCPITTPLGKPREADAAQPIASRTAGLIDKAGALRTCGLRMGGRLPTRAERARAREVLGLSTVMVTESAGEAGTFRFSELPEWVTKEPCDNPNIVGACDVGWFPSDVPSSGVPWSNLRDCEFTYSETAVPGAVDVGESCPTANWKWNSGDAAQALPCRIQDPSRTREGRKSPGSYGVACLPPADGHALQHPPEVPSETAAYRCVLPQGALGSFDR